MNSSNSVVGPSPSVAPPTRSFLVLLLDGTRLRVSSSELAMQLRQERSAALKRLRQARAEALAQAADRVSEARIRSAFEANERAMDAAIRRLSKQVRVKPEPKRRSRSDQHLRSRPRTTGHGGLVLAKRAYSASALAQRDRLGREGLMLRIRYLRAGGKHASPGCLRRHWFYIAREAAVTLDSDGEPIVLSNLGETIDDVAEGVAVQEQVLRATRKNAKLGFRMVGAFPYGFPVDARREVLQRIGDQLFGARGLPWSGAAHDADPAADVDNPHFHLDYGLLPMTRQPDGSYIVSNDLRTDLDGQEGLRFIRHMVAHVMTEVALDYGLERTFTALSYRERGMDREGGEHVGQEATAAHRRGDDVASVARNEAKRRRDEAREKARKARARLDALERLKRAIEADEASIPTIIDPPTLEAGVYNSVSDAPTVGDLPTLLLPAVAHVPQIDAAPVELVVPPAPATPKAPPLPLVIRLSRAELPVLAVPAISHLVAGAPDIPAPPVLGKIGNAPPRIAPVGTLQAITAPAPPIQSAPVVGAIGDETPALDSPPTLYRLGTQPPRMRLPELDIRDIGDEIPLDLQDDALEARLRAAIEQVRARRSENTVEPSPIPVMQAASGVSHVAALEAIRLRDDWVRQDEDGIFTCSEASLRAVGLTRADMTTPAAQDALAALGKDQRDRFDPIFDEPYSGSPFRMVEGMLRLDARFSAELRADVARWGADSHFQAFVTEIWPSTPVGRAPSSDRIGTTPDAVTQVPGQQPPVQEAPAPFDPWMQAALMRERAMSEWDEIERSDTLGSTRPGRALSRPGRNGTQEIAEAAPRDRTHVKLHPDRLPGGGSIGD